VELELHLFAPVCDVSIVNALHEDCPRMCMVGGGSRWLRIRVVVEGFRYGAVYERAVDLCAFDTFLIVRWRHLGLFWSVLRSWDVAGDEVVDQVRMVEGWQNLKFSWWRPLVLQGGQCSFSKQNIDDIACLFWISS
jgi:hypothetical protein